MPIKAVATTDTARARQASAARDRGPLSEALVSSPAEAAALLEQVPERHRAVHVEEVSGEDGRGLGMQELPSGRVGVPLRRWRNPQGLEDPADHEAPTWRLSLSGSPGMRWYLQPWFSVASRSMSAPLPRQSHRRKSATI
jgi:hypothetical protein